jgi:hypothetical protein
MIKMLTIEKFLWFLALLSLVLRYAVIIEFNLFVVVSFLLLSSMYFLYSFFILNQRSLRALFKQSVWVALPPIQVFSSILAGIVLSAICIGSLYVIEGWGGGQRILIFGLSGNLILMVVAIYFQTMHTSDFWRELLMRTSIIGGMGLLVLTFLSW